MAKLFHILAASVGSGLVLGASIRLGEAIGSSARKAEKDRLKSGTRIREGAQIDAVLADRLDRLEKKMRVDSGRGVAGATPSPEWRRILADVVERVDRQQSDVEAIRRQVGNATRLLDTVGEMADGLRSDLHRQLSDDLDRRLAAVEEKLQLSLRAANRDTVSAMVASIEARVTPRISRLEAEINDQSAVVAELRECSLQSERSILRLLTVIERTVNPKPRVPEGMTGEGAGQGMAPDPASASDSTRTELPKLSVVTGRGPEETGTGTTGLRRPASFR